MIPLVLFASFVLGFYCWFCFFFVMLYAPREIIDSDLFMKFLEWEEVMLGSCCCGGR